MTPLNIAVDHNHHNVVHLFVVTWNMDISQFHEVILCSYTYSFTRQLANYQMKGSRDHSLLQKRNNIHPNIIYANKSTTEFVFIC